MELDEKKLDWIFLLQVDLLQPEGLRARYQYTPVERSLTYVDREDARASPLPPELDMHIAGLRDIVRQVFGISEDNAGRIEVSRIRWTGTGDKKGMIITATYEAANGAKIRISTPRILFAGVSFGFEQELKLQSDAIKKGTFEFLLEERRQMEDFNGVSGIDEEDIFV